MNHDARAVFIWGVGSQKEKLDTLFQLVEDHFFALRAQLILVQDSNAALYIDRFLWEYRKESFLPHIVTEREIFAPIAITTTRKNINNAPIVINLAPLPIDEMIGCQEIHELQDQNDAARMATLAAKRKFYEEVKWRVIDQKKSG